MMVDNIFSFRFEKTLTVLWKEKYFCRNRLAGINVLE